MIFLVRGDFLSNKFLSVLLPIERQRVQNGWKDQIERQLTFLNLFDLISHRSVLHDGAERKKSSVAVLDLS